MNKLFSYADKYIKKCGWKDIALLKLCLCSAGIIIGLCVSPKRKKPVFMIALAAFVASYIPLMSGFVKGFLNDKDPETDAYDEDFEDYDEEDCIKF